MKRILVFAFAIFFYAASFSQLTYYAAAKAGLSIREQPNTSAKILDKVPYGEKLTIVANTEEQVPIFTEGFNGYWWKVKYKDKTGYIVSSYVLPLPVPKAGTKTLKDYFNQVSPAIGKPLVLKSVDSSLNEMGESSLTKQFYKNGMEWHRWEGYESASELCLLPDFSIEQCFLLVRLIDEYHDLISEKDNFPTKNSVVKNPTGNKTIEVQREKFGDGRGFIKKIKIISEQGAVTEFEIFMLETQAVIFWASGA
jgi:hypothetical protein